MANIEGADPRLPVELEREVFMLAASNIYVRDVLSLLLVARRVRLWVTPILYRSFAVCHGDLVGEYLPLRRTPREFRSMVISSPVAVTEHIRDLWIITWVGPTQLGQFLSACSGIETLGIFGNSMVIPGILPALARMPLRRLSVHLLSLFGGVPGLNGFKVDFGHPMFSRLTHLSLQDRPAQDDWASWTGLFEMPCLTHLASKDFFSGLVVQDVLARCRTLRLLVLKSSHASVWHEELVDFGQDVRCVVIVVENSLEDWEAGVIHGEDCWTKAEDFCKKRQTGEVEGLVIPFS
ncbi:hypothetical protein C8F04DRAFT_1276364 [Mycena alexandri]|uniref:Uncharacterized protein n=1 Tax=Mycena alexandri TaxID=1745969 RepID=A0AAD6WPX1_9AGAR|nr:hypothetical protein C8F04DRAFT_1276364 [Mycena alexandri]